MADYRRHIRPALDAHFAELVAAFGGDAELWIMAQISQESGGDVRAVSHVGARGLMQLMPDTARELGVENIFDPAENITAGVRYMAKQWRRLDEITAPAERIRFALAAYNCGRGYINMAMVLAREDEGLSGSHTGWRLDGRPPGQFQQWRFTRSFLAGPFCRVAGRTPDYEQVFDYVAKVEAHFLRLKRMLS